ncbi:MAG TPA: hypothetical protein VGO89_14715, partial [Streptomyces sp.]|nr:hypothetical protein [Streptomyces sp.]
MSPRGTVPRQGRILTDSARTSASMPPPPPRAAQGDVLTDARTDIRTGSRAGGVAAASEPGRTPAQTGARTSVLPQLILVVLCGGYAIGAAFGWGSEQ